MMKNYQYYVEAGAAADANGAELTIGTSNNALTGFYNFVDRPDITLNDAVTGGLVGKATLSYNLAEDPKASGVGVSNITCTGTSPGNVETLFGPLSSHATTTLPMPGGCAIKLPNKAINATGPSTFLITLEDRTVYEFTMANASVGSVAGSPLGHNGPMGGRERASRLAGRF